MSQPTLTNFIHGLSGAFRDGDARVDDKRAEAENLQRLQAFYALLGHGQFSEAANAMTEDVEFEIYTPPMFGFVGRARGRVEALAALQQNFAWVEAQQPETLSLVAQGDQLVVIGRERGRLRATGEAYDVHWTQIFEFRNGQIARFREWSGPPTPSEGG
jgi:ketosteroid isomerase-like protein